jgi:hypothetical protein
LELRSGSRFSALESPDNVTANRWPACSAYLPGRAIAQRALPGFFAKWKVFRARRGWVNLASPVLFVPQV